MKKAAAFHARQPSFTERRGQESNPPGKLLTPHNGFEDREAHQHLSASGFMQSIRLLQLIPALMKYRALRSLGRARYKTLESLICQYYILIWKINLPDISGSL